MKFLILFLLPLISAQEEWISFQTMEYYIGREKVTHKEASNLCQLIKGQLAVIRNETIHNFLVGKIRANLTGAPHSYWIGLTKFNKSGGDYKWVDGLPLNYTHWSVEEPSNHMDEDCVIMGHPCCTTATYNWYNIPCSGIAGRDLSGFICQRERIESAETTAKGINKNTPISSTTAIIGAITTTAPNAAISTNIQQQPISTNISSGTPKFISTAASVGQTEAASPSIVLTIVLPVVAVVLIFLIVVIVFVIYCTKKKTPAPENIYEEDEEALREREEKKKDIYIVSLNDLSNLETNIYESASSLELEKEKEKPKKPLYTEVKKVKQPNGRESLEIAEEVIYDSPRRVLQSDSETTNPDPDPYITFSDMQSLADSTYSLCDNDERMAALQQPTSDVYDALDQNR